MNDLNTKREVGGNGSTGTYTACLFVGGWVPPATGKTEEWNGTNWTERNDLNTARRYLGAAGTSTATVVFGGDSGGDKDETELWMELTGQKLMI